MKEPIDRSLETNTTTPDFQKQIDAITNRILTPDNIDEYANEALDDLIGVVDDILAEYDQRQGSKRESGINHERAAFVHFGMMPDQIELVLDHVANLAAQINSLDEYIKKHFDDGDTVVTPPDALSKNIASGDGSFGEKQLVARLKTTLLLLQREFGIDLDDESQICKIPGIVKPGMMRHTPYNLIDLPTLNRMIDICDEEGNRTFVFDREKILAQGLSAQTMANMSKDELKGLLVNQPGIGRHFRYSNNFVQELISSINDINQESNSDGASAKLLRIYEVQESDEMTVNQISIEIFGKNTKRHIVHKAIAALEDDLGEVKVARIQAGVTNVYNPVQIQRIKEWVIAEGYLEVDHLFSRNEISTLISEELQLDQRIDNASIQKTIDILIEDGIFGQSQSVNGRNYYTREQLNLIKLYISEDESRMLPLLPDNYVTPPGLAKEFSQVPDTIHRAIAILFSNPGEIRRYRSGNQKPAIGISPEQKQVIVSWLESEGYMPPEGYLTVREVSIKLGITFNKGALKGRVRRFIDEGRLSEEDLWTRFNTARNSELVRYSPRAVEVIKEEALKSTRVRNRLARKAVEQTENTFPDSANPDKWKFRRLSNEEIANLADQLSPNRQMTTTEINDLARQGLFPNHGTIISRFGSVAAFNEARGLEQLVRRGMTNDEIIKLAHGYSPNEPMTQAQVNALSRENKFPSTGTIDNRFGSLTAFNELRGFDMKKISDLSNDELVALADTLLPGERLTADKANELSKQKKFVSAKTLIDRFGSMGMFHEKRGFSQSEVSN